MGAAAITYSAGLSLALGAFLAGLLVGETEFKHQTEVDLEPFKGLLLGLFFMTVGMSLDLPFIADQIIWILAALSALVAGVDGLDDIRQIIAQSPQHLEAGGWLLLEHGYDQAEAVRGLLAAAGFTEVHSRRDLGGHERISLGRWTP